MVQLEYATVQNGAARWSQNWHFVPKSTAKRFFFQISQRGGNAPVQNFARPQYFRQGVEVPKNVKKYA